MTESRTTANFVTLTERSKQAWAAGDYNVIGLHMMPVAEGLVAAADPRPGQRVLDVGCGTGNAALVAARRDCETTGIDFVPAWLERARGRAAADGVKVDFLEADAQTLPFGVGSFDVVLSIFAVMFAPTQQRAADELVRVTRPGGRIGLASWTPEGYGGEFFRVLATYAPPFPGVPSPTRWGTEEGLKELLGGETRVLDVKRLTVTEHFRTVDHMVDAFVTTFGPVKAIHTAAPDDATRTAMRTDLAALFTKYNEASDGTMAVKGEYLQAVLERR
jgi:SAM-dependent methyltransferase